MNHIQVSRFFTSLGVKPNHRGYIYLIHLVKLGVDCRGKSFPYMKDFYQQTADYFGVTKNEVENNVRTVVHCYWIQKDSHKIFSEITHYPVTENLTVKEFVSVLSEYISNHPL